MARRGSARAKRRIASRCGAIQSLCIDYHQEAKAKKGDDELSDNITTVPDISDTVVIFSYILEQQAESHEEAGFHRKNPDNVNKKCHINELFL